MRDPPLPDESNPYLQKSPSTMVCVGFPLPKTTPPENSLAGGGIVGLRPLTNLILPRCPLLTPCPHEAWCLGCEVFILVASGVWLSHQCTEVRFTSFLSGGFITAIVVKPPERKLAKHTSVQWVDLLGCSAFHTSPLITKSVVALGDQGMLCWVCTLCG